MTILFILRVFGSNLLTGTAQETCIHIFVFMSDLEFERGLTSKNPTHYLLDYYNFKMNSCPAIVRQGD